MGDLEHALSQVEFIQHRFAASTRFRGFAPQTVVLTAILAIALASAQTFWPTAFGAQGLGFVQAWILTAVVATSLVGVEAMARSRRLHGGMADLMMAGTLRLLFPFGAVGLVITLVIVKTTPETIWILPGLWPLLVALIGFSAANTLPRTIIWPSAWFFVCGTVVLLLAGRAGAATPWMMGIPFGIGQALVAVILYHAGTSDARH
jgi:hypothetical protein